jgi:hypothetical protein
MRFSVNVLHNSRIFKAGEEIDDRDLPQFALKYAIHDENAPAEETPKVAVPRVKRFFKRKVRPPQGPSVGRLGMGCPPL